MESVKKILQSFVGKIAIVIVCILVLFGIRMFLEQKQEKKSMQNERVQYAKQVDKDNVLLKAFQEKFTDAEVILACEEDLSDDGRKDLVVIYQTGKLTRMVVVIDKGEEKPYKFTEPVPGPVENQKIQFKNIDEEDQIEFIISGEKREM